VYNVVDDEHAEPCILAVWHAASGEWPPLWRSGAELVVSFTIAAGRGEQAHPG
jgi:hypothetical protein